MRKGYILILSAIGLVASIVAFLMLLMSCKRKSDFCNNGRCFEIRRYCIKEDCYMLTEYDYYLKQYTLRTHCDCLEYKQDTIPFKK